MAKEKNINTNQLSYEKQRFLEIRYPSGDIGFDGCTDSHQHNELHGPWPHLYVKEMPPLRTIIPAGGGDDKAINGREAVPNKQLTLLNHKLLS